MSNFKIALRIEGLEDFDHTQEILQPFVNEIVDTMQQRIESQLESGEEPLPELLAAFGALCICEAGRIQKFRQERENGEHHE